VRIATSAAIVTGTPSGSVARPGAMRVGMPASGPYSSNIRSEKPFITFVVRVKPGLRTLAPRQTFLCPKNVLEDMHEAAAERIDGYGF
jgi:hypothetical protein